MRIIILSHAFEPTGAPLACLSLAVAAKRLGHDVDVYSPTAGLLINEFGKNGIQPLRVVDHSYDLYITSTAVMLPQAHRLREMGKNVLPIIHEMMDYHSFADRPSEYNHDWMLDKFEMCVCVSTAQRDAFKQTFPRAKLALLEYCCLADQLGEKEIEGLPDRYIVYPGGFERRKGHNTLARKILASRQLQGGKIVLLGASKQAVAECVMPDEVRTVFHPTDFVSPSQALTVVRNSDALVSFSLSETKGLSVMDALWYGKRVLLSPIPAFRTFSWSPLARYSAAEDPYDPSDLEALIADAQHPPAESDLRENERVIRGVHSSASYEARVDMLLGLIAR